MKKTVQWYKVRYDELSGSGGTMGRSDWKYMLIPLFVVKEGKDSIRDFIEINTNCDIARIEYKKTDSVPRHLLEEKWEMSHSKAQFWKERADELWRMLEEHDQNKEMKEMDKSFKKRQKA